ncbi:MAG: response regulator transcription factor [Vampirovibrionales bacterium]|nr:response regulator transcription factor [Vampirovibrionales bacterium]
MAETAIPLRVLLADDHPILRQGLKQLLSLTPGVVVAGEAGNGQEAVAQAMALKPDVILMDAAMPLLSGYDASRAILTAWPQAKILALTNEDDPQTAQRFLDIGVLGFLLKDAALDDLAAAIRQAAAGQTVPLAPEMAARVAALRAAAKERDAFTLTAREREVLGALARGHSNQQLADVLCVSPKTVHNHLYSIYSKIGVASRSEAIVWALRNGF